MTKQSLTPSYALQLCSFLWLTAVCSFSLDLGMNESNFVDFDSPPPLKLCYPQMSSFVLLQALVILAYYWQLIPLENRGTKAIYFWVELPMSGICWEGNNFFFQIKSVASVISFNFVYSQITKGRRNYRMPSKVIISRLSWRHSNVPNGR